MIAAGLTAFYMTRLFILTFHGPKRYTEENKHPHESPLVMTIPLIFLAIGAIVAGFLMKTSVVTWLTPVLGLSGAEAHPNIGELPVTLLTLALVRDRRRSARGRCSGAARRSNRSRPVRSSPRPATTSTATR